MAGEASGSGRGASKQGTRRRCHGRRARAFDRPICNFDFQIYVPWMVCNLLLLLLLLPFSKNQFFVPVSPDSRPVDVIQEGT